MRRECRSYILPKSRLSSIIYIQDQKTKDVKKWLVDRLPPSMIQQSRKKEKKGREKCSKLAGRYVDR